MRLVVCTCAECARLDRAFPNEGKQLALLPQRPARRRHVRATVDRNGNP